MAYFPSQLCTVEVNNTFYRLFDSATFESCRGRPCAPTAVVAAHIVR
ncbi:hypothetical protein [Gordonia oryzae]